jgi:hypothetical protein
LQLPQNLIDSAQPNKRDRQNSIDFLLIQYGSESMLRLSPRHGAIESARSH